MKWSTVTDFVSGDYTNIGILALLCFGWIKFLGWMPPVGCNQMTIIEITQPYLQIVVMIACGRMNNLLELKFRYTYPMNQRSHIQIMYPRIKSIIGAQIRLNIAVQVQLR